MKIRDSHAPATETQIVDCEQKIGCKIPEPCRAWLKDNGGEPEPHAFWWTSENGRRHDPASVA